MNIGRSVKIALAQRDKDMGWLSSQLGVGRVRVSAILKSQNVTTKTVVRLADIFGVTASEFIALGEDRKKGDDDGKS